MNKKILMLDSEEFEKLPEEIKEKIHEEERRLRKQVYAN